MFLNQVSKRIRGLVKKKVTNPIAIQWVAMQMQSSEEIMEGDGLADLLELGFAAAGTLAGGFFHSPID